MSVPLSSISNGTFVYLQFKIPNIIPNPGWDSVTIPWAEFILYNVNIRDMSPIHISKDPIIIKDKKNSNDILVVYIWSGSL